MKEDYGEDRGPSYSVEWEEVSAAREACGLT
jgi:hypothetical protein